MQRLEYDARFPQSSINCPDGQETCGNLGRETMNSSPADIALLPSSTRGAGTLLVKELMQEAGRAGTTPTHVFVLI